MAESWAKRVGVRIYVVFSEASKRSEGAKER